MDFNESDYEEDFNDDNEDFNESDSEIEDIEKDKEEDKEEDPDIEQLEDDISEIYQPKQEKKIELKKIRNVIIVPLEERITDNRLHKNEAAFVLSTRAKEISMHYTNFVKDSKATSAIKIAYEELYSKRCPLKIRRQVGITKEGDIIVEEWDTKEMVLPNIKI